MATTDKHLLSLICLLILNSLPLGAVVTDKHLIPEGDLFQHSSCPHFFMEILIYSVYCAMFWWRHTVCNSVGLFVLVNQLLAGHLAHRWYQENSLIIQGRELLLYLLFIIADWQGFHHQRKRNASPYSENCCIFVREFSFLCKFILRQEILSSLNYSGKLCIHVSCSIYFFLCKFISKSGGNFLVTINHTCESFFIVLFLIQINYNKGKAC